MNTEIALWLLQDGLTTGAIYALLALALLLVFAVTRIIFVPQGEFVALAALTLGVLQQGGLPGTVWLLLAAGAAVVVLDARSVWRAQRWRGLARLLALNLGLPLAVLGAATRLAPAADALAWQMALTLAIVVPLGPMLYRIAFQRLAGASVLVLFIVSMAVHYALAGLALLIFGGEGLRTTAISDARFPLGPLQVGAQSLWVMGATLVCMAALWAFFERTLLGKALRATAMNRVGARLVGVSVPWAGALAFSIAAAIGALSGILISPIATIYYDTGLMIGLKGFLGAILGGMGSYPLAALGALAVGILEAGASFWASSLKESIVFAFIIPVLLWLSLRSRHLPAEDDDD